MVCFLDPVPSPPEWLPSTIYTQYFFSFSLAVAGFFHLASHGFLSKLGTGIYVGLVTALATYFQKWILNRTSMTSVAYSQNQLLACQWTSALALLLCAINVPMVSLFSIAFGDAFGRHSQSDAPFDYDHIGANVPAIISDAALLLFGIINSLLFSASGSYFWTLLEDGLWSLWKLRYTAVGTRL